MFTSKHRHPVLARSLAVAGALSILAPSVAGAQEPTRTAQAADPPPPRTSTPVMRTTSTTGERPVVDATTQSSSLPNRSLFTTGLVVFGGSYGASVIGAAFSDRDYHDKLYYPVAGPWLALDDRDCDVDSCRRKTLDTTLLIGSGVLQGLGALSLVMSFLVPERTTQHLQVIGNEDFSITPIADGRRVGAGAFGRF